MSTKKRIVSLLIAVMALMGLNIQAAEAGPCTWWSLPYLCRR